MDSPDGPEGERRGAVRCAVFASGSGSNLQALIDRFDRPDQPVRIALVVSDRDGAGALDRAETAGIPTRIIPVLGRDGGDIAADTLRVLDAAGVDMVALAGYLRLVPPEVVARFRDRILNVHPALLPAFGGAGMYGTRVHRAVLESGAVVSGATVHLVDEEYDRGPILAQWPVPVLRADTPEGLAARVLAVEHRLYPIAVEVLARHLSASPAGRTDRSPAAADLDPTWSFVRDDVSLPDDETLRRVVRIPQLRSS